MKSCWICKNIENYRPETNRPYVLINVVVLFCSYQCWLIKHVIIVPPNTSICVLFLHVITTLYLLPCDSQCPFIAFALRPHAFYCNPHLSVWSLRSFASLQTSLQNFRGFRNGCLHTCRILGTFEILAHGKMAQVLAIGNQRILHCDIFDRSSNGACGFHWLWELFSSGHVEQRIL